MSEEPKFDLAKLRQELVTRGLFESLKEGLPKGAGTDMTLRWMDGVPQPEKLSFLLSPPSGRSSSHLE